MPYDTFTFHRWTADDGQTYLVFSCEEEAEAFLELTGVNARFACCNGYMNALCILSRE